jgi:hypothetical protein
MIAATAFAAVWLLVAVPVAAQPKCTFPGKTNICRSPNGKWILHWQQAKPGSEHVLIAERVKASSLHLMSFKRSIDVLWSPQSTYIAINDHSGSSDTNLFVVELFSASIFIVDNDFQRMLNQRRYYENGHRYFNARRWQTDTKLVFEVKAYDAEPGIEARGTFVFDVKSRTVSRKD